MPLRSSRAVVSPAISEAAAGWRVGSDSGPVVTGRGRPSEAEDDDGVVLDVAVHAEDIPLLRALGVTAEPEGDRLPTQESWYRTYRQEMVARFVGRPDLDARPSESHLIFDENGYAGPMSSLGLLSEESAARLSAAVIQHSEARRPWVMRHSSQPRYGKLECPNPALAGSEAWCWPPRLVSAKQRLSLGLISWRGLMCCPSQMSTR